MLSFGGKEMVKVLNGPWGRGSGRDVGVATILSLSALGGDKMARTASLPSSRRSMYLPLPARKLQARRGPFCAKDRSGHVCVTCCCSDSTCCANGLDMLHAGKRITQKKNHQRTKLCAVKTQETVKYLG
jgi:hypothetical protein